MTLLQLTLSSAQRKDTTNALRKQDFTLFDELNISGYSYKRSIVAVFEEQVTNTPDTIAVIFGQDHLTYKQLNERANQMARFLQRQGVTTETLVPICMDRSIAMIVGILGILKAGGAYVPIDPEYPTDRINYMLEDTRAAIALCSAATSKKLNGAISLRIIAIDTDSKFIAMEDKTNLTTSATASSLAYVIYTSGSAGRPNGVMIEQSSVVSLVKDVNYVSLDNKDVLLVTGSPSVDATTFEYWGMLLNGGRLILCELAALSDHKLLAAIINKQKVNIMWFNTSWFNQLADINPGVFAGLKTILVGGEKLSEQHIERIRKAYPQAQLINAYGPTENTTFSLTYAIDKAIDPIPMGKPLDNRKAYVMKQNELSAIGETGEICVGGVGIARGYLNNPELTAEKFVDDPFSIDAGARIYRTGDLGRWLPNGNIEYMGRIDDDVKTAGSAGMKIMHIITNLYAGGAQTFVVLLAIEQKMAGHDVSVVIIDELSGSYFEQNLIKKLAANGIGLISTDRRTGKNLSIFKSIYNICSLLKAERPNIINTHLPFAHMIIAAALKGLNLFVRKKLNHVITIHNAPEVWNKPTLLLNKNTPAIYCSNASRETTLQRNCKSIVIENGIEQPAINNSWESIIERYNIDQDHKIVLCVGKLAAQKNYELVGRIVALNAGKKVSFLICGLPDDTYEKDVKMFNSHANIHYLGVVVPEEAHSLMARCDCFLNTSIFEGLPITILETFFIGTKCLLSPIAPHYEIGQSMPNCFIADSFDPEVFNKTLTHILSLKEDRPDILVARQSSLEKFKVSRTARRYIDFYGELCYELIKMPEFSVDHSTIQQIDQREHRYELVSF